MLWQIYRVGEFRHFVSTTRFGELQLSSDASAKRVIWITLRFLFVMVGVVILFGVLAAQMGTLREFIGEMANDEGPDFSLLAILMLILGPLAFLITYAVLAEVLLRRALWAHYAGSIALTNTSELAGIIQREGDTGGAFGDSFDPASISRVRPCCMGAMSMG